jgi:hypothetical protein
MWDVKSFNVIDIEWELTIILAYLFIFREHIINNLNMLISNSIILGDENKINSATGIKVSKCEE